MAKIGTKADTPEFRDRMHQEQTATTQLVKSLLVQLTEMTKSPSASAAVFQRLRQQFDREFRRYQSLNTQMDEKQVKVIEAVKAQKGAGGHYDEEDPLTTRPQPTYGQQYDQQQQQLTAQDLDIQFIEYDIEELEKRQREIGQIEQDVQEVGEMFKDLAVRLKEETSKIRESQLHLCTEIDRGKAKLTFRCIA